jgi:uncharacterized circularly permuted ATP-grasp superfamily protein/uncharacterized alpha-E superfamily protein
MATGQSSSVKSTFARLDRHANEARGGGGQWTAQYRGCLDVLERLHPDELARRQEFVRRATADLGLHADRMGSPGGAADGLSLDLFPRILRPDEWRRIEAGVTQRLAAFGALVRDLHSGREILRAGNLPAEVVFEDPAFHMELHGVPICPGNPITLGAVDLVRTAAGEWRVLAHRFSTPTGISHVIQIRRILAQALPELFEHLTVVPVAGFVARMAEALAEAALTGGGRRPLVVLLAEGDGGTHFFEESFLARHMGIPLTRPEDIVVRDGCVFLKTIEGLHRIDVIYRRMEPGGLDPVAFAATDGAGIPGLIQCLRRGTVRVVNALGCAVADNPALLPHDAAIIRHYTGEAPLLRSMPQLVAAQQLPELSRLPVYDTGQPRLEPFKLRVFCLAGRRTFILPGGLTRLSLTGGDPASGRRLAFKDTWALREQQPAGQRKGRLEPEISATEVPLTSRAAEAFYWLGRYLERGRSTARLLNTLEELRWGELSPAERELYAPLWIAIIQATGDEEQPVRSVPAHTAQLVQSLMFDAQNPASVRCCFASARRNAEAVRSLITPELWRALSRACEAFPSRPNGLSGTRLRDFMEAVVESGDRVYGTAHRTLLHDAGWHFLNIGMLLERGLSHVVIQQEVLPRIALRQWQHLRDDSDLTALLRLMGALDAYHRRYRSRAYLDRVAQLLWTASTCPASVRFIAAGIMEGLERVETVTRRAIVPPELPALSRDFLGWLENLPLERLFPARALELDRGLTRRNLTGSANSKGVAAALMQMRKFFEDLHGTLEDRFYSHHPDAREEPG